jgi:hypothetical protein
MGVFLTGETELDAHANAGRASADDDDAEVLGGLGRERHALLHAAGHACHVVE